MPSVGVSHASSGILSTGLGTLGTCLKALNSFSIIGAFATLYGVNLVSQNIIQPGYNAILGTKHDVSLVEKTFEYIGSSAPPFLFGIASSLGKGFVQGGLNSIAQPQGQSGNRNNPSPSPSLDNQWSSLRSSSDCILDEQCVQGPPNERSSFIEFILPTAFLAGTLWICTYAYQRYVNVDAKKTSESEQNTKKK
jgi:hypothetical protein